MCQALFQMLGTHQQTEETVSLLSWSLHSSVESQIKQTPNYMKCQVLKTLMKGGKAGKRWEVIVSSIDKMVEKPPLLYAYLSKDLCEVTE